MKDKKLNKYNLSRDIPNIVKREVRQRDCFGCVLCGNPIIQYEHVKPEYKDAKSHDPKGITLLCGGCHDSVTRKIIPKYEILEAMKNPFSKQQGIASRPFSISKVPPIIKIARTESQNCKTIIKILGEEVLSIKAPIDDSPYYSLYFNLKDNNGTQILLINDNEMVLSSKVFDIKIEGNSVVIYNEDEEKVLALANHLPSLPSEPNIIEIEKLNMIHKGIEIEFYKKSGRVKSSKAEITLGKNSFIDQECVIEVNKETINLGSGGLTFLEESTFNGSKTTIINIGSG